MKISKLKIVVILTLLNTSFAKAATININSATNLNVNDPSISSGDTINFLGNGSTLVVNADQTLATVTAVISQQGIINFSSANILTMTGNIGTAVSPIQNITFNANGTLIAGGDVNTSSSGTTTTTNNQGNITLSGTADQNVSSLIGSANLRLNTISITQSSGAITFSGNVFATNLATSSAAGEVVIAGAGGLNFSNSAFGQDTTINSSGNNSFGATTLSSAKTLTLNSDSSLTNLTFGTSGNVVLASGKTATITGNISGTGIIKGSATNTGFVLLSGSAAQSVASTAQLGDLSNRLNKISISNISTSGIALGNDVFTTNLDFTNTSGTAKTTIASDKEINILGNITQTGSGGASLITGSGKVNLSGSVAQAINSKLGSSTSDRLGELVVSGSGGITLNQNSFLSTLRSTGTSAITNNAALDTSAFNVTETTSISGTGTNSFGVTTISDSKNLTLNSNASLTTLSVGTSSNLILASGKTATITGDISGAGLIKGSSDGLGNITLSGSSAQNVEALLGDSSDQLNQISVSNISGINFNNNIFTTTLDFTNSSSTSTATIASGKTLNVSGDITQSGAGNSIITGSSGIVSLSGSSAQNINSGLGSSTLDRLGQLIINNTNGVTLNQDAFLTNLTFTSGALTINSPRIVDVSSAVDLSGQTLNLGIGASDSLFGRIKSGSTITVDNSTVINFDYSNNSLFIAHDGTTQFDVAESTAGISGAVSDIQVSDNSFLFNNSLALNGNKIVSTISQDTTNFDIGVLGSLNFTLLNNVLENTDLTAGIISISSQTQLEQGLATLKPISNESIVNISAITNNNIENIIGSHLMQINADYAGFAADDKKYKNDGKIWGQVFGITSLQSKVSDNEGYRANNGGLMFGGDHIFKGETNIIVGGALAYTKTNISNNLSATTKNNNTSINSYHVVLYNNNAAKDGLGFYNNNIVNFSYGQYQTNRNIVLGSLSEIAQADFNGSSYGAKTSIGYNFKLEEDVLFAPNFGIKYFSITQDNYQETGAGKAGLKVVNEDFHSLTSEVGFNLTSKFEDEYFNYIPRFNASWERYLKNNKPKSNFSFIGGGTRMEDDQFNIEKNKFNVGLAINISDESASSFQLQYNLQLATKFISNSASLQYRYVF